MANDNRPVGLFPLNTGGLKTIHTNIYQMNTGTDIYLYAPVNLQNDGLVGLATPVSAGYINILGVAMGFLDENQASIQESDPFFDSSDATDKRYVLVADDPNQEFLVQGDSGATVAALTNIGNLFPLLYQSDSGNETTGIANLEIDQSAGVTTTAGQVQLLRVHDITNSDGTKNDFGNFCKFVVRIWSHQRAPHNTNVIV